MNDLITQFDAGSFHSGEVENSALSGTWHPEQWLLDSLTWGETESGERVNPVTALSHGPVWQAVNILAGDVGQLPFHVYRKKGRNRERDDMHPVDWLLTMEPNVYQTPAIWKEMMMAWSLLWGNGCSYIARDGAGRPSFFIPLLPDRTVPKLQEFEHEGVKYQEWWIETDFGDGKRIPLPYEDVFHVRGLATDGFWGLSAIDVCKQVIGAGLALRKHGNRTFKNQARPAGALENVGKAPPPEVRAEYRREIEAMHSGSENAGRWLFLWGGTKFTPMSMSNSDAQWLEAADMDREQVASIFNLPPYKLGAMKNSAVRANLEQQNTDYLTTSLSRHLNKFKEEGERKLFNSGERRLRRVFLKWIVEAFLRGDLAARGAYYSQAKTGEWLTTNEIRELEDMNPIEGGDVLKNPAINPAESEKPKEEPRRLPAPEPSEEAKQASRELVSHQVAALLDAEARAVERACNPEVCGNLCRWAETYYESYQRAAAHFLERACNVASASGLGACDWRRVSADHARDSLNRLLAMAGIASMDGLPDIGREFSASVQGQRQQFSTAILGGT